MGIVKSGQPRKKRKFIYNAPLHLAAKFLNAHLSKELRAKMKKRAVRVRKGDTVKIMSGKFAGVSGKVLTVLPSIITVEGAVIKKIGGKEISVPIHPSKVIITQMVERK